MRDLGQREACVLESDLEEEAKFFRLWWDWMSFERIGNLSFDILRFLDCSRKEKEKKDRKIAKLCGVKAKHLIC